VKVLAWVPQEVDSSPGQRFRIEQWDPHLRRAGIEITYSPFAPARLTTLLQQSGGFARKAWSLTRALGHRIREAWNASEFDLIYVFREGALLGPAIAERILSGCGIPFVFDFDDAIWIRYVSPANSYLSYLRFPRKTATLCRLAGHVIAGNRYLADYASRYNARVSVIPTTIDTVRYELLTPRAAPRPVIGWTGSYSTVQYLQLVSLALARLRTRREFRVVVVGGTGFSVDGVDVEHRPWRSATEVQDISCFDIGIMPLPDAEWERGKCGLKALQYMALGIPPVVSPVGINREIVDHGRNGFLAATEDDWVNTLDLLLGDPELRFRVGRAARATVEGGFSAMVQAPRVAQVFRSAIQ
jgi:glycosyltransferase involved in cell wall biosynthesis